MSIFKQSIKKLREDTITESKELYHGDISKAIEEGLFIELEKLMYNKDIHTSTSYDLNFDFKKWEWSVSPQEFEDEGRKVIRKITDTEEWRKFYKVVNPLRDKRSKTSVKNGKLGGRPKTIKRETVKRQIIIFKDQDDKLTKAGVNKSQLVRDLLEKYYFNAAPF